MIQLYLLFERMISKQEIKDAITDASTTQQESDFILFVYQKILEFDYQVIHMVVDILKEIFEIRKYHFKLEKINSFITL